MVVDRDKNSKDTKKSRKARYTKPQLRIVELRAEETLAVGCKFDGGPINTSLPNCGITTCILTGS